MTHLVASLTLNSARSYMMQGAFLTQGKASSIPNVFSWGDSISPEGFLSSILLLVVIIVAVVIIVILVVVVVGEGWANEFHQDKASLVRVPVVNFTLQLSLANVDKNAANGNVNGYLRLQAGYSANSKVNSVNGISQRKEGSFASLLRPKEEVIMAIPEEEGDGHIKEVIRVEYEWKPPHCVECKIFGHSHDLCPKRVRDEVPKAPSMVVKPSTMEDNEEGFVEVKRRKKNKGDASRSFSGIRLPKPNSKVHWQPKKSVDSKGGSNTTSPSGTIKESDKGVKEDVQNHKVSDHAGASSSNLHVNKDQEESLWSRFNKGKENAKSKSSEIEDESDDDEVYMPHGGGFIDGMEDDLECYDGYRTHVYDLTPPEQAFCDQYDIRLNSRGRK
ncbi:hypothetical protein Tco_0227362 [Tanacetum coccineum]